MSFSVRSPLFALVSYACLCTAASPALAQRFAGQNYGTPAGDAPRSEFLREVEIKQRLGAQLPLETSLRDETGKPVRLGDYFHKQPVVLIFAYYRCPQLCTQVLNGFLHASQAIPQKIGRDYQVVTISIDPTETPEVAAQKKLNYVKAYRRPGAEEGWHFLTADAGAIERLTSTAGFHYRYDPASTQYAHASGIMIATPNGKLARYFYGIEYRPPDVRLGLVESSEEKIGSAVDQILLLCFHYDPLTGRYGLMISRLLKITGSLTALALGTFIVRMLRHERRLAAAHGAAANDDGVAHSLPATEA